MIGPVDGGEQFSVTVFDSGTRNVGIAVSGAVSFTNARAWRRQLRHTVHAHAAAREVTVVELDLRGVTFLDAAALAVLDDLRRDLAVAGMWLRIGEMSPHVRWLLRVTGQDPVFGQPPARAAGIDAEGPDGGGRTC